MSLGDVFMIDLATPIDTLPLFNCTQNLKLNRKETFSYIFHDNLDYITHLFNLGRMRPVTYDNIQKTILCGSIYLGWDFYECPVCHEETIIPHSCHSRFCTKCGVKETKQRAAYVSSMALDAKHRHIVFTILWELRDYLIRHRELLDYLFIASRNTLACVFNDAKFRKKKAKEKNDLFPKKKKKIKYSYKNDRDKIIFGSVMTLHTFGRDLQWNPHIHCLVCEEAFDTKKNKMKNFSFISYEKLRKTWMYQLLDILTPLLGDDFKHLKKDLYRICENGFYVYAKKRDDQDDDVEECVKYITRYTSRPPMAESRIIDYDPMTKQIHWFYHRHQDDQRVDVHEHVYNFIQKVIRHCPNKNFKMTRYYGFYSNKFRPILDKIYELYGKKIKKRLKTVKERRKIYKRRLNEFKYRCHMIKSYLKDPLLCRCGELMIYSYSYNPLEGGMINDRQYREKCLWEIRRLSIKRRGPSRA